MQLPIYDWQTLMAAEQKALLQRPAIEVSAQIEMAVSEIIAQVICDGDEALKALTLKFDKMTLTNIEETCPSADELANTIEAPLKAAIDRAYQNIYRFHAAQKTDALSVEIQSGIHCQLITRPIPKVGLYIPGGSAPLFSTILMLGIPAQLAGCEEIVLCTPPGIHPAMRYCAALCGIQKIYTIGGAQAIAAMAFGTETIPKVDKIFGPGNAFVTEAKRQVSQRHDGAAIDMPAGPSEVLVVADEQANPEFVAADLLSQAEHGADSQVMLVASSLSLLKAVNEALSRQLTNLPRQKIASTALKHSRAIYAPDLKQCFAISNAYAPEHLIVQTVNPDRWLSDIQHAGSVFLGAYTPESMGDYASGTNHVLPTYGYAKTCSSLSLADFSKRMTVQQISAEGLQQLGPHVAIMANEEALNAHARAVLIRLDTLKF